MTEFQAYGVAGIAISYVVSLVVVGAYQRRAGQHDGTRRSAATVDLLITNLRGQSPVTMEALRQARILIQNQY